MQNWDERYAKLRVLVIEDEPIVRNMIEYALKVLGIKNISLAANGEQGLEQLGIAPKGFDLIICDWMMPSMDGLEFLNHIRSRGSKTPFLMLTAKATKEAVVTAQDAGVDSYIAKPFSTEELHKKVRAMVKDISDESFGTES